MPSARVEPTEEEPPPLLAGLDHVIRHFGSFRFNEAVDNNPSKFVLVGDEITADQLLDLKFKVWKLARPSAVISIMCGTGPGVPVEGEDSFKRAIITVAEKTNAWVLTRGTASGVGRVIGGAIGCSVSVPVIGLLPENRTAGLRGVESWEKGDIMAYEPEPRPSGVCSWDSNPGSQFRRASALNPSTGVQIHVRQLQWHSVGNEKPARGHELTHAKLAEALSSKSSFTTEEWGAFGISDLQDEHFIRSSVGDYFKPETLLLLDPGHSHFVLVCEPTGAPQQWSKAKLLKDNLLNMFAGYNTSRWTPQVHMFVGGTATSLEDIIKKLSQDPQQPCLAVVQRGASKCPMWALYKYVRSAGDGACLADFPSEADNIRTIQAHPQRKYLSFFVVDDNRLDSEVDEDSVEQEVPCPDPYVAVPACTPHIRRTAAATY